MASFTKAQGLHLVGSAPYESAEDTFRRLASTVPGRLRRMPDGEPGQRNYWTWFMHSNIPDWALSPLSYPAKLAVARGDPDPSPVYWFERQLAAPERKPGEQMAIKKPTLYVEDAISSYSVFKRLKDGGVIDKGVRFQVSIPTSTAFLSSHILKQYKSEADAVLEPQLLDIAREIQAAIPADDLAIQWDLATEVGALELETEPTPMLLLWFDWFEKGTTMAEVTSRLRRYAECVKEPVELGFHFCYGDVGHQHWAQPRDTGTIVSLFTEVQKVVKRRINFIHLPVPQDRDDDDYFSPLAAADFDPRIELYLGLVREGDLEGTQRRLETAQRVIKRPFGVATECGMARIANIGLADDVLRIAAAITDPVKLRN